MRTPFVRPNYNLCIRVYFPHEKQIQPSPARIIPDGRPTVEKFRHPPTPIQAHTNLTGFRKVAKTRQQRLSARPQKSSVTPPMPIQAHTNLTGFRKDAKTRPQRLSAPCHRVAYTVERQLKKCRKDVKRAVAPRHPVSGDTPPPVEKFRHLLRQYKRILPYGFSKRR